MKPSWNALLAAILVTTIAPLPMRGAPDESLASQDTQAPAPNGRTGCELKPAKRGLAVVYVAALTPAAEAGLKTGDTVTAIDDVPVKEMKFQDALRFMNGPVGGIVTVTFHHDGGLDQHATLTRQPFLDVFTPAAQAGDPQAQFLLGYFYTHFSSAPDHQALAAQWFRQSADQGYAKAETDLGYQYECGLGVSADQKAAAAWYLKAARQDDAAAEQLLAQLYYWGRGVPQSDMDSFKWNYRSAQQDNAKAENALGYAYETGRGVVKDHHAAFAWEYRSAELGNPYGAWELSYLYETGRGAPRNLTEAYRWIRVAQAGLPENAKIRKSAAVLSLGAFVETRDFATVDVSLVLAAFHREIIGAFAVLAFIYVGLGVSLLAHGLTTSIYPPRLWRVFAWAVFFMESQFVALLAIFIFGKLLSADLLLTVIVVLGAFPLVISTLGKTRCQIWRPSSANWRVLLLLAGVGYAAFMAVAIGYYYLYSAITGVPLPSQPTMALIGKTKDASLWIAYASIAIALPTAEEVLFRGYFFDALRRRFSGLFVVVATAFCFSIYHCQSLYILPLFAFGLVLGWVKLKTNSLFPCLAIHVLNNAMTLTFGV